jgi:hypothetical protein
MIETKEIIKKLKEILKPGGIEDNYAIEKITKLIEYLKNKENNNKKKEEYIKLLESKFDNEELESFKTLLN